MQRPICCRIFTPAALPEYPAASPRDYCSGVLKGAKNLRELVERVFAIDADHPALPRLAHIALRPLVMQLNDLQAQIRAIEVELLAWHRTSEASKRLETIPGVGFITATAIAATVTDPTHFKSGRQFAAWLGLTPKQNSSGGKERLGGISKMGDRYLRTLLVVGATSVIRYARDKGSVSAAWINRLLAKKPARLVSAHLPTRRRGSHGYCSSDKKITARRRCLSPLDGANEGLLRIESKFTNWERVMMV